MKIKCLSLCVASAILAACGGGGGGSSTSADVPITPVLAAKTFADYYQSGDTGLSFAPDNPTAGFGFNDAIEVPLGGVAGLVISGVEITPMKNGAFTADDFKISRSHILRFDGTNWSKGDAYFPAGGVAAYGGVLLNADLNNDRVPDVFLATSGPDAPPASGGDSAMFVSGAGKWSQVALPAARGFAHSAAAGTVAGKPSVYMAEICCGDVRVPFLYVVQPDGSVTIDRNAVPDFVTATPPSIPGYVDSPYQLYTSVAIADLNGDGFDDLILGTNDDAFRQTRPYYQGSVVVYGTAQGFKDGRVVKLPGTPLDTATEHRTTIIKTRVGDLFGNGKKYIVQSYYGPNPDAGGGIQILEPKGDGTYIDVSQQILGARSFSNIGVGGPGFLYLRDINADGCLDLVANRAVGAPEVYLNDCKGALVDASAYFTAGLQGYQLVPVATGATVSFVAPFRDFTSGATGYKFIKSLANLPTPVNGKLVF
jgi:hypothetical protein